METFFYNQHVFKRVALILMVSFLAVSCSSDKDDEPGLLDTLSAIKTMSDGAPDFEKKMEEIDALSKVTPLDFSTLKALLPNTLLEMPQRKVTNENEALVAMQADIQLSMVTALYGDGSDDKPGNNNPSLSLSIQDGAGELGSATLGLLYITHTMARTLGGHVTDDDGSYTKEISLQGHTVLEKVEKLNNGRTESCLNFASGDRFIVILCSEDLEMAALKSAFSQIDIEAMNRLAG